MAECKLTSVSFLLFALFASFGFQLQYAATNEVPEVTEVTISTTGTDDNTQGPDTSSTSSSTPVETPLNDSSLTDFLPMTNTKVEDLALDFYMRKTDSILAFLNRIIPEMNEVSRNMSTLMAHMRSNKSSRMSLAEFREADQILDETLNEIGEEVAQNNLVRQNFSQIMTQAENHFESLQKKFLRLLSGDIGNPNGVKGHCGGHIPISRVSSINYNRSSTRRKSKSNSNEETCIWFVTNGESGAVEFRGTVKKLDGINDGAKLTIFKNLHLQEDSGRIITKSDINRDYSILSQDYVVIVFSTMSGYGNPGFGIDFYIYSSGGKSTESKVIPTSTEMRQNSFDYKVDHGGHFPNTERAFLTIFPEVNKRVSFTVDFIQLQQKGDHLGVYEYSRNSNQFQVLAYFNESFDGEQANSPDRYALGSSNQPILLLFVGYQNEQGSQFTATYNRSA